jgi:hypothetical protein
MVSARVLPDRHALRRHRAPAGLRPDARCWPIPYVPTPRDARHRAPRPPARAAPARGAAAARPPRSRSRSRTTWPSWRCAASSIASASTSRPTSKRARCPWACRWAR